MLVGSLEQPFTLHKDILCNQSSFFQAAFNGRFAESRKRSLKLPDLNVEDFKRYIHWAYSGEVVVVDSEDGGEEDDKGAKERMLLARLYVVGDQLGETLLRNTVIDKMFDLNEKTGSGMGADPITIAYAQTPEGSKLRLLVRD